MGTTARGFWHRKAPADSICLYRVGLGLITTWDAASWLPHSAELFSSDGFHLGPLAALSPPPSAAFALCLLLVISALCVAGGLFTRTAIAVTLVLESFLYALDGINEKANTSIVLVAMTILLFSRCGSLYSLDAWRRRRRERADVETGACIFPQRLLQLELAQVYFFAGLIKLTQSEWLDGSAIWNALGSRWGTGIGVWITDWLPDVLARAASLGTVAYEISAPFFLLVPRTRPWAISLGVLFHLAILATLSVGSLNAHFLLALILLYPAPETIARLFRNRSAVSGWR